METFQMLQKCKIFNDCLSILNDVYKEDGELRLALALNDCKERYRRDALKKLDPEMRLRIVRLISNVQLDKARFDPRSLFPSVITEEIINTLVADKKLKEKPSCEICHDTFNECADIIWKNCGRHLMHLECFKFRKGFGEMPLIGPCACIEEC